MNFIIVDCVFSVVLCCVERRKQENNLSFEDLKCFVVDKINENEIVNVFFQDFV